MKKLSLILLVIIMLFPSCKQGKKSASEPLKEYELQEVWKTDTVILVPESVAYDQTRKVLYVSDLNYDPRVKDGMGFISKMGTDGTIIQLHWVDGLNAPKGLVVVNDKLYAADIDQLVEIDVIKGEITNRIKNDSLKMINDVAADPDGNLYVSDSDGKKIYKFSNGQLTEWLAVPGYPNGLLVDGKRLLLATDNLSAIDIATKELNVITPGIGHGDGIASIGVPGHFLVTDWNGEIFMVYPDSSKVSLLNTKDINGSCADLCYIPELNLVVLPTFNRNYVAGYKLVER